MRFRTFLSACVDDLGARHYDVIGPTNQPAPSTMPSSQDERKSAILSILRPNTEISAATLAQRLGHFGHRPTRRTLERDLAALVELGDVVATGTKPRMFSCAATAPVGLKRHIDAAEAVVLQLASSHLRRLLPAHLDSVFGELFEQARASTQISDPGAAVTEAKAPLARWADLVRTEPEWLPRLAPAVPAAVHEAVSEALLSGQQLQLRYRKPKGTEPRDAIVSPLGLVQRGPVTFLIVIQREDRDPFTLALHRIASATVLPVAAVRPARFKLDDYLAQGNMQIPVQGEIDLVLAVAAAALPGLQEAPLARGQVLTPMDDGRHRLTVTLPHTLQLEWWILGMGDGVEVLAPAALRSAIAARLRSAAKRYRARPT